MFDEEFNESRRIEPEQEGDRQEQHETPKQDREEKQADIRQEDNQKAQPHADQEQRLEQDQEVIEEATYEDEEEEYGFDSEDYTPDFVQELLENPPLWADESKEDFQKVFESYEETPDGRAKTDAEFLLVYRATVLTIELLRYDRMKAAIVNSQQRPAAEIVYRKTYEDLVGDGDPFNGKATERKWGRKYFSDPDYRKAFAAKLETTGYGAGAIEAQAFLRALPTLAEVERLITAAEKRLANTLKRLDACFAGRHREKPMWKSYAASRYQNNGYKVRPSTDEEEEVSEEESKKVAAALAKLKADMKAKKG